MALFGRASQNLRLLREPRIYRLDLVESPYEIYRCLALGEEYSFLLESVSGPRKLREYSFIGFDPYLVVRLHDGVLLVEDRTSGDVLEMEVSDPAEALRWLVLSNPVGSGFRFLGGAVGYLSYDAVRYWEKLPDLAKRAGDFPDMEFAIYDRGFVIDHRMGETYYYTMRKGDDAPPKIERGQNTANLHVSSIKCNVKQSEFEDMVRRAKEYIAAGDIFQVVLSKRYDMQLSGDVCRFYEQLRELNPSPYMYLLKMGERQLVGASPEMLFRVEGGKVETFPIAGTRPVTSDEEQNRRLAEELLRDPKELAEHVMLVDLARNDLGRVCRYGTVRVSSFMEVHRFSHVQHIVSHVVGELRLGYDCLDALRAVFPAGTVTGAPKVRAMEIIEELERERRGPYAGCVGYVSFNGSADFAITIRTLAASGGSASIQVGAGIVADSKPEREWMETEHKAAALLAALGRT